MKGKVSVLVIAHAMMRAFRYFRRAAMVAGTIALAASALNAQEASASSATPRDYEISAQSLDVALNTYIRASGAQVLYETALTMGKRSMDVKGTFTPEVALNTLLSGTGLVAHRTDVDAFVITLAPAGIASPSASTIRPDARFMTALQIGILEALCRTSRTQPGEYKVAIELWIASTGSVQRSALVGSTGDAERDRALLSALRNTSIRMAPPAGLPQPFILTIGPRSPRETGDCAG